MLKYMENVLLIMFGLYFRDPGYPQSHFQYLKYTLAPHMTRRYKYRQTHRHTDVLGSLHPGTKISFLVAREGLPYHWLVFPSLTGCHKIDHFGTLAPRC